MTEQTLAQVYTGVHRCTQVSNVEVVTNSIVDSLCASHDNQCGIQPSTRNAHPYCSASVDSACDLPCYGKMSINYQLSYLL